MSTDTNGDTDMHTTMTHEIDPREIREAWGALMQGERTPAHKQGHVVRYGSNPEKVIDFAGMSGQQIADALANGYYPEGEDVVRTNVQGASVVPVQQVYVNEDEGELLVGEVLAGEEEFLARYEDMPEQRGAKIRIEIGANCSTPARVMQRYFDWCVRMIEEFQMRGNAPAVELLMRVRDLYRGKGADHSTDDFIIPLVKEGEAVDPITWRAFLTCGSFRTLGFLTFGIIADRNKWKTTGGLGYSVGDSFSIMFDEDEGVLEILCPSSYSEFPEEDMTRRLNEILERF